MTNIQIERVARSQSIINYSYTWSQGRAQRVSQIRAKVLSLVVAVTVVLALVFLPACSVGTDPTPTPQSHPAATAEPQRHKLCGEHEFLCR